MNQVAPKSRRERGVLAQREYRKRHASKVQKLQDENKQLKEIIRDIDQALVKQGALSDELKSTLAKARELAGFHTTDEVDETPVSQEISSLKQLYKQMENADPAVEEVIRTDPLFNPPISSGRASPRLDYGLWLDPERFIRIIEPPVDVIPYLGSGMNTLAGCIFWSTMEYTIDLWNSRKAPLSTKHLDRMFSHSRHLADRQFLISLAQARLDYKRKGFMYQKLSQQFERNAMYDLYERVKEDYEKQGQPSRWWKRPDEVADMALEPLDSDQKARFQAVIEGKGAKADAELLRPLITWAAQNFICFGDGPRWSSVFVSVAIGSWLNSLKEHDANKG